MKPHLLVKLRDGAPTPDPVPSWAAVAEQRASAGEHFLPAIDALIAHYRTPVLVTREHAPTGAYFGPDEIRAGLSRLYRLILRQDQTIPPGLIADIALLPEVEYVRPARIGAAEIPPATATSMSVETDRESRDAIFLDDAHVFSRGVPEVTVAVLDTGVQTDHPELADAMLPGYDFVNIIEGAERFYGDFLDADEDPSDQVGHGTHVAGIIAGRGAAMPLGVVPRCRILPVRVLGALQRGSKRFGAGDIDNISQGMKWAVDRGAAVINVSLGVEAVGGVLPHEEVVDYARRKGVSIVAASGNDGSDTHRYYPGALPYAMAVGATDEAGDVAAFSTYGEQLDFVAPGTNVYSSFLDSRYAFSSGTSHATPFVCGGVAMLHSIAHAAGRRLSDGQVKYVLRNTADRPDRRLRSLRAGFGRLNLVDAARLLTHKFN